MYCDMLWQKALITMMLSVQNNTVAQVISRYHCTHAGGVGIIQEYPILLFKSLTKAAACMQEVLHRPRIYLPLG